MSGDRRPRVVIAGSRALTDAPLVWAAIEDGLVELGLRPGEVVSGTARGVDRLGERWAEDRGIPVRRFPANWARYGRSAGNIRNWTMAAYADAAVVVWDGRSRGSARMVEIALELGLPVAVRVLDPGPAGAAAIRRVPPHAVARMLRRRTRS